MPIAHDELAGKAGVQCSISPDRLLFVQAPDAIIFADREGVIREWNVTATAIFGHTADEAIRPKPRSDYPGAFCEAH